MRRPQLRVLLLSVILLFPTDAISQQQETVVLPSCFQDVETWPLVDTDEEYVTDPDGSLALYHEAEYYESADRRCLMGVHTFFGETVLVGYGKRNRQLWIEEYWLSLEKDGQWFIAKTRMLLAEQHKSNGKVIAITIKLPQGNSVVERRIERKF